MLLHCLRLVGFVALLWVVPALAQSSPPAPAWVAALRDGGHVIVVRHGATYADQADTNPLDPKDTPTSASSTIPAAPRPRRWAMRFAR